MLLGEPPRTQADVNFSLFGFPVRIHPFFWLVALFLGWHGPETDPVDVLIWVAAVLISILVHELGHAAVIRSFGGDCWITLHGMGGLASSNWVDRSTRQQILILLAGPVAGFVLAALTLGGTMAAGHPVIFTGSITHPFIFMPFENPNLQVLVYFLITINILWGLINLLPVYPLDGGQIAREVFVHQNPSRGIVQSLGLSALTAVCLAVYALVQEQIFMMFLFGLLAYENYVTLRRYRGQGPPMRW